VSGSNRSPLPTGDDTVTNIPVLLRWETRVNNFKLMLARSLALVPAKITRTRQAGRQPMDGEAARIQFFYLLKLLT
jgi:hypothetical protein